jgi:hypothetical protein
LFSQEAFEGYYPKRFQERVVSVFSISGKQERRSAKSELLREVLDWSRDNPDEAVSEWAESAQEPIRLLGLIGAAIG